MFGRLKGKKDKGAEGSPTQPQVSSSPVLVRPAQGPASSADEAEVNAECVPLTSFFSPFLLSHAPNEPTIRFRFEKLLPKLGLPPAAVAAIRAQGFASIQAIVAGYKQKEQEKASKVKIIDILHVFGVERDTVFKPGVDAGKQHAATRQAYIRMVFSLT